VLAAFEPAPVPIQIVYPHSRLLSSNVRAFIDLALAARASPATEV
jgi:DNA-binding transcriptional LysR family regulator